MASDEGSKAFLREVVDSLKEQPDGRCFHFLEAELTKAGLLDFCVSTVAKTLVNKRGIEAVSPGLMKSISKRAPSDQIAFTFFVQRVEEWNKKGFKKPRTGEPPHRKFGDTTPSLFGKNSKEGGWPHTQAKPSLMVMCGRPCGFSWINVCIMNRELGIMSETLKDGTPEPGDFHLARQLTQCMPNSYEVEDDRRDAINNILNEHLFSQIVIPPVAVASVGRDSNTDGSILQFGFNIEYKNEKGAGGGDPYMENVGYFCRYWGSEMGKDGPQRHCCPWIIMEVIGQEIGLSGAVWAMNTPTSQPLSPNIPFLDVPADRELFMQQARLCQALRLGVTGLAKWYEQHGSDHKSEQAGYPYERNCKIDGFQTQICYTDALPGAKDARKMLFMAKRASGSSDEHFVVKFTDSYGMDAHKAFSKGGFAPQLHDVKVLKGGLCMVVMEFIEHSKPIGSELEVEQRDKVKRDLMSIKEILSSEDLVHGDMRPPNVHVKPDGGVVVFDFDWAGKSGEVKYPDVLNKGVKWHEEAVVGQKILVAHDAFMIEQLLKLLETE